MSNDGKKLTHIILGILLTTFIGVLGYAYANHETKISGLQETKANQTTVERIETKIENKAEKSDTERIEQKVDDIYKLLLTMKNKK